VFDIKTRPALTGDAVPVPPGQNSTYNTSTIVVSKATTVVVTSSSTPVPVEPQIDAGLVGKISLNNNIFAALHFSSFYGFWWH